MASVAAGEVTDHEEKRALVSAERGRTGEGRRKPDTAERGDGISQFSVLPSKSCGIQLRRSDEPTMAKGHVWLIQGSRGELIPPIPIDQFQFKLFHNT